MSIKQALVVFKALNITRNHLLNLFIFFFFLQIRVHLSTNIFEPNLVKTRVAERKWDLEYGIFWRSVKLLL